MRLILRKIIYFMTFLLRDGFCADPLNGRLIEIYQWVFFLSVKFLFVQYVFLVEDIRYTRAVRHPCPH